MVDVCGTELISRSHNCFKHIASNITKVKCDLFFALLCFGAIPGGANEFIAGSVLRDGSWQVQETIQCARDGT